MNSHSKLKHKTKTAVGVGGNSGGHTRMNTGGQGSGMDFSRAELAVGQPGSPTNFQSLAEPRVDTVAGNGMTSISYQRTGTIRGAYEAQQAEQEVRASRSRAVANEGNGARAVGSANGGEAGMMMKQQHEWVLEHVKREHAVELQKVRDQAAQLEMQLHCVQVEMEAELASLRAQGNQDAFKSVLQAVEDYFKCSLCREVCVKPVVLECAHTFCAYCLKLLRNASVDLPDSGGLLCPVCRAHSRFESAKHTGIEGFVAKVFSMLSPEDQSERQEVLRDRQSRESQPLPEATVGERMTAFANRAYWTPNSDIWNQDLSPLWNELEARDLNSEYRHLVRAHNEWFSPEGRAARETLPHSDYDVYGLDRAQGWTNEDQFRRITLRALNTLLARGDSRAQTNQAPPASAPSPSAAARAPNNAPNGTFGGLPSARRVPVREPRSNGQPTGRHGRNGLWGQSERNEFLWGQQTQRGHTAGRPTTYPTVRYPGHHQFTHNQTGYPQASGQPEYQNPTGDGSYGWTQMMYLPFEVVYPGETSGSGQSGASYSYYAPAGTHAARGTSFNPYTYTFPTAGPGAPYTAWSTAT